MNKALDGFPPEQDLKRIIMDTSSAVWKREIKEKHLEEWLNNFKGEVFSVEEERVVALWLLCNFVFYNEEEVRHLCLVLLKEYLHQMLLDEGTPGSVSEYHIDNVLSSTGFVSLGKPSESGAFVLYYFRQVNDLHLSYFPPSDQAATAGLKRIVFLDDVTLSAGKSGQAYSFLKKFDSQGGVKILLSFIATREAVEELEKIGVRVICAIVLDGRNKCFEKDSFVFSSFPQHTEACRKFAYHYGKIAKPSIPLGYEEGQFSFGFFYNTPDNTLPIFWGTENGWRPVFIRYEKNYFHKKQLSNLINEAKFI